jgi:hypothetical protein
VIAAAKWQKKLLTQCELVGNFDLAAARGAERGIASAETATRPAMAASFFRDRQLRDSQMDGHIKHAALNARSRTVHAIFGFGILARDPTKTEVDVCFHTPEIVLKPSPLEKAVSAAFWRHQPYR